jgi:hypothetical protein
MSENSGNKEIPSAGGKQRQKSVATAQAVSYNHQYEDDTDTDDENNSSVINDKSGSGAAGGNS